MQMMICFFCMLIAHTPMLANDNKQIDHITKARYHNDPVYNIVNLVKKTKIYVIHLFIYV
jgi:hypothetical protein